jgi:hypothetical protein
MTESFLYYIWQFQYLDKKDLQTEQKESISIFRPGLLNTHSGPDFSQAKIRIEEIDWVGNVEIHLKSSDWMLHNHDSDPAYDNVILHVVWEADAEIRRTDGSLIPTLQLKAKVDEQLIKVYKKLMSNSSSIPCEKSFKSIGPLIKISMLDKAALQRMEFKANAVLNLLASNNGDWEETTYQLVAKNFGFKVNSDSFLQLSNILPFRILQKHASTLLQVEALLFGQAGLLETKTKDEYLAKLFQEYVFLSKKYSLYENRLNPSQWKFLRLRPANFPTLRLAQLASILVAKKNLFSAFVEADTYQKAINIFDSSVSDYWHTHYHFAKKSKGTVPSLGESAKQNALINTMVPILVAYGKSLDQHSYLDRAIEILQAIPAEKNKITRLWSTLGISVKTAFDSQALIEQFNNNCQKRQCLNCVVGASLIKPH